MRKLDTFELNPLVSALRAQEAVLSELTALNERQSDSIGGVIVVLRALIDIILDAERRAALKSHLNMMVAGAPRRSRRAVIDTLLD